VGKIESKGCDLERLRQTAEREKVEGEVELLKKEASRREWLALQVCTRTRAVLPATAY